MLRGRRAAGLCTTRRDQLDALITAHLHLHLGDVVVVADVVEGKAAQAGALSSARKSQPSDDVTPQTVVELRL